MKLELPSAPLIGARLSRRSWLVQVGLVLSAGLAGWLPRWVDPRAGESNETSDLSGRPEGRVDFNSVVVGDQVANACTPEIPAEFVGIRINAPPRVVYGVDQFVVCGTYRFAADYIRKFDSILYAIVLVLVDARTHKPYVCNLIEPGDTPEPGGPAAREDPDWMVNHRIRKYFNVDVMALMEGMPRQAADYFVYALLEDHVSNVVRVSFKA